MQIVNELSRALDTRMSLLHFHHCNRCIVYAYVCSCCWVIIYTYVAIDYTIAIMGESHSAKAL